MKLALYYCRESKYVNLEREIGALLDGAGKDPRQLAQERVEATQATRLAQPKRFLCVFVPTTSRKAAYIDAAATVAQTWGNDTDVLIALKSIRVA